MTERVFAVALDQKNHRRPKTRTHTLARFCCCLTLAIALHATHANDPAQMCVAGSSGNFGLDITVCTSAIRSKHHDGVFLGALHLARGRALRLRGDCQAAISDFDAAESLIPFSAAAPARRGVAQRCLGQLHTAVNSLTVALERNPFLPAAWRDRGISYFFSGQFDLALVDLSRADAIDKYDAETHSFLGLCQFIRGQFGYARHHFDVADRLGHAWQYQPLWRLITRRHLKITDKEFNSRLVKRTRDVEWPAPLFAKYLDLPPDIDNKRSDLIDDAELGATGVTLDQRRVFEQAFYLAMRQFESDDTRSLGFEVLKGLAQERLLPPSAELTVARALTKQPWVYWPDPEYKNGQAIE